MDATKTFKFTRFDTSEDADPMWCEVEIKLRNRTGNGPELTVCGASGYILTEEEATEEAKQYWISYFEDMGDDEGEGEALRILRNMGRSIDGITDVIDAAAQCVLDCDGEYHGLDFHDYHDGDKVLLTSSCGQIREEMARFFPEVVCLFEYHLNSMVASKSGDAWLHVPLPAEVMEALTEGSDLLNRLAEPMPVED